MEPIATVPFLFEPELPGIPPSSVETGTGFCHHGKMYRE